jgi:hypothetical protein
MGTVVARTAAEEGKRDDDVDDSSRTSPSSAGSARKPKWVFGVDVRLWWLADGVSLGGWWWEDRSVTPLMRGRLL